MSNPEFNTFMAWYEFTANSKVCTTQNELTESVNDLVASLESKWSDISKLTYQIIYAVNNTTRHAYIYISLDRYKLNYGFTTSEKALTTTVATGRFNGTRIFCVGLLTPNTLASDTTDLLYSTSNTSAQVWTSDTYKAVPTAQLGSLVFTTFDSLQSQLTTAGYIVYRKSQDPTIIIPGTENRITLDHYAEINSPSQAINAVVLQQDPNQILLNDKTTDNVVMKNYAQLYLLSYFFKTKKLPKFVT
jgi:hypothetical protein